MDRAAFSAARAAYLRDRSTQFAGRGVAGVVIAVLSIVFFSIVASHAEPALPRPLISATWTLLLVLGISSVVHLAIAAAYWVGYRKRSPRSGQ